MKVVVLGAGVIGTTSAWYLARTGHEVMVVDRQPEVALETSFANGGQISVSHCEPWANLAQWLWSLRFLFECLPGRTRRNTAAAFALALYSQEQLRELRRDTGIRYDSQTRGILHLYEEPREFERAKKQAELLRARGLETKIKTPQECFAVEPALKGSTVRITGGAYAASDESGDAQVFTHNLAELCRSQGVSFRFKVSVRRLEAARGAIERVVIDDEEGIEESLRADA